MIMLECDIVKKYKRGYKKMLKNCKKIITSIKQQMPERSIESAIHLADVLIKALEIDRYPIPIVSILNDLGFSVLITDIPKLNISGFIVVSPDLKESFGTDKVITVAKNDTTGRQRFTYAHEFAHYLFDFHEDESMFFLNTYDTNQSNTAEEKIPSRFAAEFLMPKDLFIKRYKELNEMTNYERISQLVDDFNVTTKAVIKRCEELQLK